MAPVVLSVGGISSLIDKIKLSTSAGVDNINSKLLKNTKEIIAMYFLMMFSLSLETGILPNDWKEGKVIPVHKSGNRQSPLNYRPISLTSVPCKIMEHVIYSHIMHFLDTNFFILPSTDLVNHYPVKPNFLYLFMIYTLLSTVTFRPMQSFSTSQMPLIRYHTNAYCQNFPS
uniref:Putative tick transposon n=1 Tax=Rhipicephalus microplus TaxID=6941 RepID=A0A6G5AA41_RHIMP